MKSKHTASALQIPVCDLTNNSFERLSGDPIGGQNIYWCLSNYSAVKWKQLQCESFGLEALLLLILMSRTKRKKKRKIIITSAYTSFFICSLISHYVDFFFLQISMNHKLWVNCKVWIFKPHSFDAACMESGDNLINFQQKKKKKIQKQNEEVVDQT